MYSDNVWDFESKERLDNVCVLRRGVQHLDYSCAVCTAEGLRQCSVQPAVCNIVVLYHTKRGVMLTTYTWCWPSTRDADHPHVMLTIHTWCWPSTRDADHPHVMLTIHTWCWPPTRDADHPHVMLTTHTWCWPSTRDADHPHVMLTIHTW